MINAIVIGILVAFLFRKSLILYFIEIVNGKYSYEYQKKFKHFFRTNPHPYCFKEEIFNHIQQLQQSLNAKTPKRLFVQPEILNFPLPTTSKDLMKLLGKPTCFNSYRDPFFDLSVLGYDGIHFGQNSKRLYYFNHHKLVLSELVFDEFSQPRADTITSAFSESFQINMDTAKMMNLELSDHTQLLYCNSGFRISVKFYSTKNEHLMELMRVFGQQQLALKEKINAQFFQMV